MRPGFIILLGGLAIAGLSVVCVLQEAPAFQEPSPDALPSPTDSVPEGDPEVGPKRAAASTANEVAARERRSQADLCQGELDALLADERIHFEVLSAAIKATSRPLLDRLVEALRHCPDARIEIAGHTDGEGIAELNQELSEARAQSVRNYLIQQGIARQRLTAVGFGSTRPIADDEEEEGRMQNRRIEFKVEEIQQ